MKPSFSRPTRSGPVRGWSRRASEPAERDEPDVDEPEPARPPRFLRQQADGTLTRGPRTDRFRRTSRP
jgi:hypothetical protein